MRRATRVAPPPPRHEPAPEFPPPRPHWEPAPALPREVAPRVLAPIIPLQSAAGRSLLAIIAIMSFLAALTLGAVVLVRTAASDWQAQVAREMTIQIRPTQGRDIDADVARAAEIARATPGIASVRIYSKEEAAHLLEPWLGSLGLDALPIPRLIVVALAAGASADLATLRAALEAQVPGASLDDHRAWVARMRAMTQTAVAGGMAILALMMSATVLLVAFATRGAMASNHAILEVLHFVGAKNRYIASHFQRHFLTIGLKGAGLGGALAVVVFLSAYLFARAPQLAPGGQDLQGLLGGLVLGPEGYAGIAGVLVLVAAIAAITSRWTVYRTLDALE
ncbi:MAG: ABC transporter permease [Variibacter sp.]|nr:ABC transporter permease [Variibacter sp.]